MAFLPVSAVILSALETPKTENAFDAERDTGMGTGESQLSRSIGMAFAGLPGRHPSSFVEAEQGCSEAHLRQKKSLTRPRGPG